MKNKLIVISIALLMILSGCNFNLKSNKKESPTVIPFYWRFSPRGNYNILSFERALVPSLWGIALLTVMATSSIIIVGADRKNEKDM